jgi:hypothetical protein
MVVGNCIKSIMGSNNQSLGTTKQNAYNGNYIKSMMALRKLNLTFHFYQIARVNFNWHVCRNYPMYFKTMILFIQKNQMGDIT